jgi:hypothetical protein
VQNVPAFTSPSITHFVETACPNPWITSEANKLIWWCVNSPPFSHGKASCTHHVDIHRKPALWGNPALKIAPAPKHSLAKRYKLTERTTRTTEAAIAEPSPVAVAKARPTDSPRDRVECVTESPVTSLTEGNTAGNIVALSCTISGVDHADFTYDKHLGLYIIINTRNESAVTYILTVIVGTSARCSCCIILGVSALTAINCYLPVRLVHSLLLRQTGSPVLVPWSPRKSEYLVMHKGHDRFCRVLFYGRFYPK